MRILPTMCALVLTFACGTAIAQSGPKKKDDAPGVASRALGADPSRDTQSLRARMNEWYEDCRKGWDVKTHMTKRDYERTCRRMAEERVKFLNEDAKGIVRPKLN